MQARRRGEPSPLSRMDEFGATMGLGPGCLELLNQFRRQPAGPDARLASAARGVATRLSTAQPDAPPPPMTGTPSDTATSDPQTRRAARLAEADLARQHLAAIRRVAGQRATLRSMPSAATALRAFESRHLLRAEAGGVVDRHAFARYVALPSVCHQPDASLATSFFARDIQDLRFAEHSARLMLAVSSNWTVAPSTFPETPVASRCAARGREITLSFGPPWVGCTGPSPAEDYFFSDYEKCVEGSGGLLNNPDWISGCRRYERVYPPPGSPQNVRDFYAAVAAAAEAATAAGPRFRTAEIDLSIAAQAPVAELATRLQAEADALATWKVALDTLAERVAQLRPSLAASQARQDQQTQDVNAAAAQVAQVEVDRTVAEGVEAVATRDQEAAAAALETLELARDAIVLECGDHTYATCPDDAARLAYDRRRYELEAQAGPARQRLREVTRQVREAARVRRAADLALRRARAQHGVAKARLAGAELETARTAEQLRLAVTQFEAEAPLREAMSKANAADSQDVEALVTTAGLGARGLAPAPQGPQRQLGGVGLVWPPPQ